MDSISAAVVADFHIVEFSGPMIVAAILHWGLFGTLSIQIYLYYQAFPNDRPSTKCLVYTVYAIELVQTILLTHDLFKVFGYNYGNLFTLTEIYFDWLTVPVMSGLVAFIAQSFYAYRVYVLSKSWPIPCFIVVISLTSSIGAFFTGALSFEAGNLVLLNNRKTNVAVGVWGGASVLCDLIIAACMTYYVSSLLPFDFIQREFKLSKHDTGFRQTRVLVSKLIRLTVETGSLTAAVATTGLVLFFAFPGRTYFTAVAAIVPKLYANSILVVLNARFQILGGRGTYMSSMDVISTSGYLRNDGPGMDGSGGHISFGHPQVVISREVLSDENMQGPIELKRLDTDRSPWIPCWSVILAVS
ncbi:hypothetical protein FB451DRAFT_1363048 [Mycena latifolia]|nr:hypothetical protein FB451DRAFT_1363048 [Mycena latifolia]